ncbi:MAG: hypothetical protein JST00_25005 [Deltaproteobacteria bacterium]|nr:hypothetical protein [Deltaproteobacteria bacterium]
MGSRTLLTVAAVATLASLLSAACGPAHGPANAPGASDASLLPDVRIAKDRPPVVLVSRTGDPSAALAIAIATAGIGEATGPADDDPEAAVAIAGLVDARLAARGLASAVTPSWSGVRATLLVPEGRAAPTVEAIGEALAAKVDDKDLAAAKKKLEALAARPLADVALARWARCVGSPHASPRVPPSADPHTSPRVPPSADPHTSPRVPGKAAELTAERLEQWRTRAVGLGRVAIAVAGPAEIGEAVASAVAKGPAWKQGAPPPRAADERPAKLEAAVYESTPQAPPTVHMTLDVGTASRSVAAAEALGDPRGPLAARLAALDLPFRVREVVGAAEARGGCVGVVLEAGVPPGGAAPGANDLAARVADAVALVQIEAHVHLAEGGSLADGRTLARRAGDPRDAAERAAWWALADAWATPATKSMQNARSSDQGSVALGVPSRRGAAPMGSARGQAAAEPQVEPTREALGAALARAAAAWQRPVAEPRVRVEQGQGETWVLVASPCGTDAETDADAGLTALVTMAAVEMARGSADARIEPWIVPDGAGLLAHGPALPGETPAAHARRLADIAARSFASEALAASAIARARADLARTEGRSPLGPSLALLASAVAPGHPSWFVATGRDETITRAADSAVAARAAAMRAGPIRVAVLANVDATQGEAAVRAADRWIDRRGDAARTCAAGCTGPDCRGATTTPVRPGTYAVEPRPGATPEAFLAYPFTDDERARGAALTIAAALDGDGGPRAASLGPSLLEKAIGGAGLARGWSARVIGAPRAPALVIRIASTQDALDKAVMQARALVDRIRAGGLAAQDYERAVAVTGHDAIASALDPRSRIVATFRGEPIPAAAPPPPARASQEDVRAFGAKWLGEEQLVVVASRPGRAPVKAATP